MRIVLIGMRGSGKSTIGRLVAKKLGWKYFETDRIIEIAAGQKISEIVFRSGWKKFRILESKIILNLKSADRAVIATGGGVVTSEKNMKELKNNSVTVYLYASIPSLTARCAPFRNRPFLTKASTMKEDFTKTFSERRGLYGKYADLTILNENKPATQTVNELLRSKICCIIGHPVSHSLSPAMHNAAYKELGLNNSFIAFDTTDLKSTIRCIRDLNIIGVSVTIPHKIKVMALLDKIDGTAKNIGAVNTVMRSNGKLTGTNTDWLGALDALKEKTTLIGKRVALIGAGGGARAIAYGLKKEGAYAFVFNRNLDHARSLSKDLKLDGYFPLGENTRIKEYDIVINATTVGMGENRSPVSITSFRPNQVVFDIVYSPRVTKFLKMAKKAGCCIITGDRMLLHCVKRQFELFTGHKAPIKVMERILSC